MSGNLSYFCEGFKKDYQANGFINLKNGNYANEVVKFF
jgi:hypothetical protein